MTSHVSPLAIHLPHPGAYVRTWKRLKEISRTRLDASGWIWGTYDDARGHFARFTRALEARINVRGGQAAFDEDFDTALRRDQRKLHDYLRRRILHRGSGFETALCRRRFPALQARMREDCDD